jgi:hypothetical protein
MRSVLSLAVLLCSCHARDVVAQDRPIPRLQPVEVVSHGPIAEMSGIVKSRRYEGIFWVHNDSGDVPRIFPIQVDGSVYLPKWLGSSRYVDMPEAGKEEHRGILLEGAANIDWEDIAIDGDTLYIADMGNNGNGRQDLGVYVLREPNPDAVERARVLKWVPVAYPDQKAFPGDVWHFDCEAAFVFKHKLYFLTKHRAFGQSGAPETGTKLYRLDKQKTDEVNVLTLVDRHANLGGWVTAADMSPDGKTLAVLCQYPEQSVWLFDTPARGDKFLSSAARRFVFSNAQQCEAVCFIDDANLLVTNEQREMFILKVADFTPVK